MGGIFISVQYDTFINQSMMCFGRKVLVMRIETELSIDRWVYLMPEKISDVEK